MLQTEFGIVGLMDAKLETKEGLVSIDEAIKYALERMFSAHTLLIYQEGANGSHCLKYLVSITDGMVSRYDVASASKIREGNIVHLKNMKRGNAQDEITLVVNTVLMITSFCIKGSTPRFIPRGLFLCIEL